MIYMLLTGKWSILPGRGNARQVNANGGNQLPNKICMLYTVADLSTNDFLWMRFLPIVRRVGP